MAQTILHADEKQHGRARATRLGPHIGGSLGILGFGNSNGASVITVASEADQGPRLLRASDPNFQLDKQRKDQKDKQSQIVPGQGGGAGTNPLKAGLIQGAAAAAGGTGSPSGGGHGAGRGLVPIQPGSGA